jgi:hypothetical protein
MKNYFKNLYESFIDSIIDMKKKPLLVLGSMSIDLSFIFVFFLISGVMFEHIFSYLNEIISAIEVDIYLITEFSSSLDKMVYLTLFYVLIIYFLFSLMQSLNWFIANKILKIKIKYSEVLKHVSLISLIYFLLISIVFYISLKISVNTFFMNDYYITNIFPIILVLILILMIINLSFQSDKLSVLLKKTFNKLHYFIIPLIIIGSLLFIVDLISKLLFKLGLNYLFVIILTGILLLKVITFSRIFLIKIGKEKK